VGWGGGETDGAKYCACEEVLQSACLTVNNFATSAALAEVYALISAILITIRSVI